MSRAQSAPRHFLDGAGLPGAGLPHDRQARIAARKAFVELKQVFQDAVDSLHGSRADWLKYQVRQAEDPVDLWLLRAAVFAEIPAQHPLRGQLQMGIEMLFPDSAMPAMTISQF